MKLSLKDEEAMCLDPELTEGQTATVQVNVSFTDEHGVLYAASRVIKLRVRKVTPE